LNAGLPTGSVTFLFSDIEDSSDLLRRVGDEAYARIRGEHHRLLRAAFDEHGGLEIDTAGDGFFVAFDSARSAVLAAVAAQRELAEFDWPLEAEVRVRVGLHTAEPHLSEHGYVGIGVHRAARICDAARGGQILLSNATAGIIEDAEIEGVELCDLGEHGLKGIPRKQRLFQLTVEGLPAVFGPPRTPERASLAPGVGTFLLSDLAGWGEVIRTVGDEAIAALTSGYQGAVTAAIEANEGVVLERAGDNVFAVFRLAANAVRAALAVREAIRDVSWPAPGGMRVSIVVHSGRWSGDPERPAAATAFIWLGQLSKIVEPDQILLSQSTAALLEGEVDLPTLHALGERELPNMTEPARVYEVETDQRVE
jgi:class 3 adenylate cyclase